MSEGNMTQIDAMAKPEDSIDSNFKVYKIISIFSTEIGKQYGDMIVDFLNDLEMFQYFYKQTEFVMSLSRVIKMRSFEYIIKHILYGYKLQCNLD